MHTSSMLLMADFRDRYLGKLKGYTVLDVGARQDPTQDSYRDLFTGYRYTGMDIVSGLNVDIVGYRGLTERYGIVISGQVMEHVRYPWEWLTRLAGLFTDYICIIAPNQWPEHRYPRDCYRFLPDGMTALFEYAHIHPVEVRAVGCDTIGIGTH